MDRVSHLQMEITFVHAPNDFPSRQRLWVELQYIHKNLQQPWLCLGDFNELMNSWEKVGGRPVENFRISAFRNFMTACSLMEIDCKGCAFAWSNNRQGLS